MENTAGRGTKPGVNKDKLPDIDLYMDQVTRLLSDMLGKNDSKELSTVLTKTMINNYVKSGVIDKPHKKRYGKKQVMQLIFLYGLKQVMSIEEIRYFKELLEQEAENAEFEQVYDLYYALQEEVAMESQQEDLDENPSLEKILTWAIKADLYKRMAHEALSGRQKK